MNRRVALGLGLGAAIGLASCTTDVSTPVVFGPQGAVITGLTDGVRGIAAGQDGVFWATGSQISYCPRSGCAGASNFYFGAVSPIGRLATDANNVYWTELSSGTQSSRLLSCPQAGCGARPDTVTTQPGAIFGMDGGDLGFLAVDGGRIYWTVTDPATSNVELASCTVGSCAKPALVALASGMTPAAVHDGMLYAMLAGALSSQSIVECTATPPAQPPSVPCDAPATLVAPQGSHPTWLVVDGSTLYFDGLVLDAPPAYGAFACTLPACIAPAAVIVGSTPLLAARDGNVYWQTAATGGFAACRGTGCPGRCTVCTVGSEDVDMPFAPAPLPPPVPGPGIVPDAKGAYAYATYDPEPNLQAIVYLPAPP